MSVRLATQGTAQALVSLLIATVTHRVVQVPPGALATPRGPGATVLTYTTVLKDHKVTLQTLIRMH